MNVIFSKTAWEQYTEWLQKDRRMQKRINDLINDIMRNGLLNGIGKPEALKHIKACSRRIDEDNRLVYNFDENKNLIIIACKGHYR